MRYANTPRPLPPSALGETDEQIMKRLYASLPPISNGFRKPLQLLARALYKDYGVRGDFVGPNQARVPWMPVASLGTIKEILKKYFASMLLNKAVDGVEPASPTYVTNCLKSALEAASKTESAPATVQLKMSVKYGGSGGNYSVLTAKATYDFLYYADAALMNLDAAKGVPTGGAIFMRFLSDEASHMVNKVNPFNLLPDNWMLYGAIGLGAYLILSR